jgi:hypothetical protein
LPITAARSSTRRSSASRPSSLAAEGLDRGRHVGADLGQPAGFGEHRSELLGEERVALRLRHDLAADGGILDPEGSDEVVGLVIRKLRKLEQRVPPPARTRLEQLGPRVAQDDDATRRERAHVLDEIEHRRLGPLKILDANEQRLLAGQLLEHPPDAPEQLVARRDQIGGADRGAQVVEGKRRILDRSELTLDRRDAAELADELHEGPVCDPGAVREAPARRDA